jgi:hypothetical protein
MVVADVPVVVAGARTGIRALDVRGRTFVPARGVFERLGARVSYTPPRLFVRRGGEVIAILHFDEPTAIVYGDERRLDTPPFVRGRRVFVPLRLVSEILGARVSYASRPRAVRIVPGAAPHRPRTAHLPLPPVVVPRARLPVAATALRPVPSRHPAGAAPRATRSAVPWWAFVPLAVVLALAAAFAAVRRRRRAAPPRRRAAAVRVRAEPVREELVVEYARSMVRIPLGRDGDERKRA